MSLIANSVYSWDVPHPFANWEALQGKRLWILEDQVTQVEDGA